MRKLYILFSLSFCMASWMTSLSQISCDTPLVIIYDDFENYSTGAISPQADHWTTFSGNPDEDAEVSEDLPYEDLYSMRLDNPSQNVVFNIGERESGMYQLRWKMYTFNGTGGLFTLQHFGQQPGAETAARVELNADATAALQTGGNTRAFSFAQDEWLDIRWIIDADKDQTYLFIDNEFIYGWPLSWTVDGTPGTKSLGGIQFQVRDEFDWFYIDNMELLEIPAADTGKYCHMAEPIDVGMHSVGLLDCYGAGFTVRSNGVNGISGRWFSYTAPEDGILSVASCNGGGDTRVWVFSGGCENLNVEGVNDDQCPLEEGGNTYASYREVIVEGGQNYLICWDNIWEDGNFDFELGFSPDDPVPGNFCQSAIPIEPGVITIDTVDGHGAVAGPNINHTGSSTTNYASSEWYSFTPSSDGLITVSSCGFTDLETRLWIYTGECGIENLELIESNDDGVIPECGLASAIEDLPVTAGTTYYIEWDSEDPDFPGFDFELSFSETTSSERGLSLDEYISLSPNPAREQVFLNYRFEEGRDLEITVYNAMGTALQRFMLRGVDTGTEKIELSGLHEGLYFVSVSDGTGSATRKLMIQ